MAPLVMHFSDDILAEIFIRLPTLEDLGRACASCPAFRSVITSHSFLRRLHAIRPPSLLGFRCLQSASYPAEPPHPYAPFYPAEPPHPSAPFYPVEPPHPSAPAARAIAEAADFKFSFLPTMGSGSWVVRDGRDGRFVLELLGNTFDGRTFAVCDPLFRRHVLLPPLPKDMAAASGECRCDVFPDLYSENFRGDVLLAPCSEKEADGAPGAFSVIWMDQSPTKLIAFIYSSASGQWREIASRSWQDLNPTMPPVMERPPLRLCTYAYGCFYWNAVSCRKLIVLDMGKMEFLTVNYPSNHEIAEVAIVELGESRRGMFVCNQISLYCNVDFMVRLFSASNQIHGEGDTEWVLENTISLSSSSNFGMLGVADGKLLLHGAREHNSEEEYGCISLDFKTGLVQRFRGIIDSRFFPLAYQYIGYPPSLSLPTI